MIKGLNCWDLWEVFIRIVERFKVIIELMFSVNCIIIMKVIHVKYQVIKVEIIDALFVVKCFVWVGCVKIMCSCYIFDKKVLDLIILSQIIRL